MTGNKWAVRAAVAALAGCALNVSAAPVQWTVASGGNGHWYEFISDSVTWDAAFAAAQGLTFNGMTGYLATITSAGENRFASVTVAGGTLAWLGGSDHGDQTNHWTWRDGPENGQAFTFTNWNGGEPNNCCGGEDYLQTNWASTTGGWNDHGGPGNANQTNGYLVEFSGTVPEPSSFALAGFALLGLAAAKRRRG